ncbi:MAG: hypothetical protein B6242_07835 [Anaerolineaceae bacterium 4572_78]|nr:MAG: hypothetical protein B6242_07835 [Anaerolineaceae bacterium 4572_78]
MSEFYNLLQQIQHKPGLYLGQISISNLYMFLQGYSFARRQLNIPPSKEEQLFREFQPWLQQRFNVQTSQAWSQIILLTVLDEQDAFNRFFDLLGEFLQHQSKESKNEQPVIYHKQKLDEFEFSLA